MPKPKLPRRGRHDLGTTRAPKLPLLLVQLDPFAELRRMGEEARAEPLTAEDEVMLESIKAAVRRKLGET